MIVRAPGTEKFAEGKDQARADSLLREFAGVVKGAADAGIWKTPPAGRSTKVYIAPRNENAMEYCYYRGQRCKHCRSVIPVFSLGHHKPEDAGEDGFTKRIINFYNYGNARDKEYLLQRLTALFRERFEGDVHFDALCVVPTHEKGGLNRNMCAFAREFSDAINVPCRQVISRTRNISTQHSLKNKDERLENVKGSLEIADGVKNKNVLVLDNLAITGANAQEAFDALRGAGAKEVYFMCFGLGSKGKEGDFDINPHFKGKASFIVSNWHWPKVSKEKRQSYAREKDGL